MSSNGLSGVISLEVHNMQVIEKSRRESVSAAITASTIVAVAIR